MIRLFATITLFLLSSVVFSCDGVSDEDERIIVCSDGYKWLGEKYPTFRELKVQLDLQPPNSHISAFRLPCGSNELNSVLWEYLEAKGFYKLNLGSSLCPCQCDKEKSHEKPNKKSHGDPILST